MAKAVERVLGKQISGGLINVKYGHTAKLKRIELNGGHPNRRLACAAQRGSLRSQSRRRARPGDLPDPGGGSALLPTPAPRNAGGKAGDH
jgi:hydroxypyruvate reductase